MATPKRPARNAAANPVNAATNAAAPAAPETAPGAMPTVPAEASTPPAIPEVEGTKKVKKGKAPRIPYPIPEGGLTTVPEDYDATKFAPLKPKDFASEADWLDFRAADLIAKATKMQKRAADIRQFGDPKTQKLAGKLSSAMERVAKLKDELAGVMSAEELAEFLKSTFSSNPGLSEMVAGE